MRGVFTHPGARVDIPLAGLRALFLVLGTSALLWLEPGFRPFVLLCVGGGLLFAPVFHRGHP